MHSALKIPTAGEGQKIGLFGGSFNPPHEGHLNLCDLAFKKLELDQIWWMVTPGNPLKNVSNLPSQLERIEQCDAMITDPRIKVTGFEASYNVRFTADTVRLVKQYRPRQKFVWLMGADNLADFHKWQDWQTIASTLPIAVIDRPGSTFAYRSSIAALRFAKFRIDQEDAPLLPYKKAPAWTFLHGPRSSISSTQLRKLTQNSSMDNAK